MRFSTIFTVLAAGAVAFASAVPEIVAKRSGVEVEAELIVLSGKCDNIIPKFDHCYDDDCTNEIVFELIAVIKDCNTKIGGFLGVIATPNIASIVVEIVTKITVALKNHKTHCDSGCPNILATYALIDISLSAWLRVCLDICLGLFVLVSVSLKAFVSIWTSIGLLSICRVF